MLNYLSRLKEASAYFSMVQLIYIQTVMQWHLVPSFAVETHSFVFISRGSLGFIQGVLGMSSVLSIWHNQACWAKVYHVILTGSGSLKRITLWISLEVNPLKQTK